MRALAPEHGRRIDELERLLAQAGPGSWPGHLRLHTAGHERDVLLGAAGRALPVAAIEWHSAPLAGVFFDCSEGDEYALEVDGRPIEGRVVRRQLLGFEQGELVEIAAPDVRLVREAGGWRAHPPLKPGLLPPRAERALRVHPWEVQLDEAQRRLVELPAERSLLLLGEAGFGKTTVALHRLARLRARAGPGFRAAVVVPTEGLRALTSAMLERMREPDVPVFRYEAFAARQAHLAFRGLPRRESVDASAAVVKLKRHPALRAAIEALVARRRKKPRSARRELEHLFGDSALLALAVAASHGAFGEAAAQEVLAHTHVQFSRTAEREFAHVVDAERLETLDGRGLDAGTPLEDAGSIDAEDYAVIFEMDRLRARRTGAPPTPLDLWDCLVIDEAQELSPLELSLLGRSLKPGGALVVAGDAAQQLDEHAAFTGWPDLMAELGAREHVAATLQVSYRCPPAVTALARRLREGEGPVPLSPVAGMAHTRLRSELHLVSWLCDELRELQGRDPSASVAVICRGPEKAERLHRALAHAVDARLALEGRFDFRAGVQVTCVPEVKGLEFDHVVIPDASSAAYPESPASRRALYVAMTRPRHHLALATHSDWSPLLAEEAHARGHAAAAGADGSHHGGHR